MTFAGLRRAAASMAMLAFCAAPAAATELSPPWSATKFPGEVTARLTLDDGQVKTLRFTQFSQMDRSDMSCDDPNMLVRARTRQRDGNIIYTLDFSLGAQGAGPAVEFLLGQVAEGQAASSVSSSTNVPPDWIFIEPEGGVTRRGDIWDASLDWSFQPRYDDYETLEAAWSHSGAVSTFETTGRMPVWLDTETGEHGPVIAHADIRVRIELPRQYYSWDEGSYVPCP